MVFCDNCGHTLKPTSKFCAKCGTKIDEMPKKEKPSISQDTGQPTTESKDWKIRKTQPDETDTPYEAVMRENYGHTKKQSGRFKKFAIGCGIFMVALVILAGFGSSNTEPTFTACTGVGCPGSATTSADIPLEFDPLLVASAKESFPAMQDLAKLVLKHCRDVNSYSDYLVFVTVITSKSERLLENLNGVDEVLTILEVGGYDEHPEVGPLIKETRSLFGKAGNCMADLTAIYGN